MPGGEAPQGTPEEARVLEIVARHRDRPGPLLEILHEVQQSLGCVPPEAVPPIARALNLSLADVHGVVSFYHHFRSTPPGRRVLRLCRAEACRAMNGEALERHASRRLGIACGGTTADGAVSLEAVYCLGLCACAPAAMLDGEVHGRLTPERLDQLLGLDGGGRPP